jgi:alginate O-acetyltransferase complex protein AlgI
MLFNSIHFVLFFPLVTLAYFGLPQRARWALLVAASTYFYMVLFPRYILVLVALILTDYVAGLKIAAAAGRARRAWLIASLVANVGVLVVFKYFNFFGEVLQSVSGLFGVQVAPTHLSLILPVGLSFHTFQSMSYTIEVYRRRQQPERHLGYYALYVLFYPQLVAGPIERPQNILHQLRERHDFDAARVSSGLRLMLWGMIKKVVVADRIAPAVTAVFTHPTQNGGLTLLGATYFFAIQIYCDFSGYSDIARGSARVMGINLMNNFDRPYEALSVGEFWRRWHISLSTWFRDYVYVPLGGSRCGRLKQCRNLLIVFVLSGIWHGANWNFVVWGLLHGVFLCAATLLGADRQSASAHAAAPLVSRLIRWFITINVVTFAWIFFRADLSSALIIIKRIALDSHATGGLAAAGLSPTVMVLAAGTLVLEWAQARFGLAARVMQKGAAFRWGLYYAGAVTLLLFGNAEVQAFIYFQF